MEAQLKSLEARFGRRERELQQAVNEAKAAASIERNRLASLHSQVNLSTYITLSLLSYFKLNFLRRKSGKRNLLSCT
jgi:hypothetical protein